MQATMHALAPAAAGATYTTNADQPMETAYDHDIVYIFAFLICAILFLSPYVGYEQATRRHLHQYLRRGAADCIFLLCFTLPNWLGSPVWANFNYATDHHSNASLQLPAVEVLRRCSTPVRGGPRFWSASGCQQGEVAYGLLHLRTTLPCCLRVLAREDHNCIIANHDSANMSLFSPHPQTSDGPTSNYLRWHRRGPSQMLSTMDGVLYGDYDKHS